jgi:hypothetical protein
MAYGFLEDCGEFNPQNVQGPSFTSGYPGGTFLAENRINWA